MDVFFFNSAFITAPSFALFPGEKGEIRLPVRWGVVQHPVAGPVVIDAGYIDPRRHIHRMSLPLWLYHKTFEFDTFGESPYRVLTLLGHGFESVKHVILTHLHPDHVGFWRTFPSATFWVSRAAMADARRRWAWTKGVFAQLLPPESRVRVFDLDETSTPLDRLSSDEVFSPVEGLRLVALPGHAAGHCGVWIDGNTRVFYGADVAWTNRGLHHNAERAFVRRLIGKDWEASERSRLRTRALADTGVPVILTHDPEVSVRDAMNWDVDIAMQGGNFTYLGER